MDLKNLYKQAQQIQSKMQKVQSDLESEIVKGESGGGAIIVHSNCKGEVQKVKINQALTGTVIDKNDVEILEDLILAAFNDARRKAQSISNERMLSAGLPNNLVP